MILNENELLNVHILCMAKVIIFKKKFSKKKRNHVLEKAELVNHVLRLTDSVIAFFFF